MAGIKYTAFGKKRAGGRLVWGVLRMDGRKQQFRTVGEGEMAQQKAEKLAAKLNRMETGERGRFLSWHRAVSPYQALQNASATSSHVRRGEAPRCKTDHC
jgi:hypothetical protein